MKNLLLRALESGETLEMIYLSDKNDLSQRKIRVLEIQNGVIKAFCHMRKRQRLFKISNILSIGSANSYKKGA